MIGTYPASGPVGAVFWTRQAVRLMDVILHLGAHRTATTTFQHYAQDQAGDLAAHGTVFWGPQKARRSVFPGLFRNVSAQRGRNIARRAEGRVRMLLQQAEDQGTKALLISDENLLGSSIDNLRAERLYPGAGERTARLAAAIGGRLRRIVLSIRCQDLWWASACALTVSRGHPVPSDARLEAVSQNPRCWRDVITDIACAAPEAEIKVLTFESYAGRPDFVLSTALNRDTCADAKQRWLNRSHDLSGLRRDLTEQGAQPDALPEGIGRWQPFNPYQTARLRENYADDLHWLIAGADGLATLTEDRTPTRVDQSPPLGIATKGHRHDAKDQRQLAQDG